MAYFETFSCVGIHESDDLVQFIKNKALDSAGAPELKSLKSFQQQQGQNPQPQNPPQQGNGGSGWIKQNPQTKEEAVKTIVAISAKLLIGHFITLFVDTSLSKFAVRTVRKHQRNKPLFDFIQHQVDMVYKKHPDYTPCNAKKFMDTSIFEYFLSEWRDKTAKEKAKLFAYRSLDNAITIVVGDIIPLPGSSVLAIPIKMALTYCGCDIGLGSVYNIAVEINGNTIAFGVNYRPIGFTLTNLILYTFNGQNKLIGTHLKNPPEKLYQITTADAEKILQKFGANKDLTLLRKEVKRINAND